METEGTSGLLVVLGCTAFVVFRVEISECDVLELSGWGVFFQGSLGRF